ncbi:RNA polymerase sigma factor [Arcicella rigui]|uniref:RNA polymerase sigma factor n=1 Tax=Arcicella rigui TaxID=797020 RepID=A0ABU5QD45_9BACT|nr:RNA polymerase sigma factor [Arcicella rigui]MEA5140755.1 RNA polymerase sigma factor [Arcicella rigui]
MKVKSLNSIKPQPLTLEQTLYIDKHLPLVEACRRGDRKAQYEIYRLYAKAMFNVAVRIVNNTGEAEDVLQDAFLDAFQKIHDFRQSSTFGAWLKQIVINRALNHLRNRKVQFIDIEDAPEVANEETYDEEGIELDIQRVQNAIQQLPDGFRTVICLYLLEGYDHEEIAEIMGVAESTSRTQYIRAKKRLLEILKK